jgi:hypothetical protein
LDLAIEGFGPIPRVTAERMLCDCALLCRRHHVAVHEGGWKLVRGPDGLTLAA